MDLRTRLILTDPAQIWTTTSLIAGEACTLYANDIGVPTGKCGKILFKMTVDCQVGAGDTSPATTTNGQIVQQFDVHEFVLARGKYITFTPIDYRPWKLQRIYLETVP